MFSLKSDTMLRANPHYIIPNTMILSSSAPKMLHPDLIVPEPTPSPHIVFQVIAFFPLHNLKA